MCVCYNIGSQDGVSLVQTKMDFVVRAQKNADFICVRRNMRVKFLGTAAAEGVPATFCNCERCKQAQKLGGKNIRTRSQILINDDLLVDFPPDTYFHKLKYNIDLSAIKTLLVTHSHMDHFYPMELSLRGSYYAHDLTNPIIDVYSNEFVKKSYEVESGFEEFNKEVLNGIKWHIIDPFAHFYTNGYEVFSLKAQHTNPEKSLFYLIKQGDKAFMQCNDTGYIYDENFEFLNNLGIQIDVISLDCTCGTIKMGKVGSHMGAADCLEIIEKMKNSNFVKQETKFFVTHFSHNGVMVYDELCEYFKGKAVPAYDGMELEF